MFNIVIKDELQKPSLKRAALDLLLDFPKIHVEGNGNHLIFYLRNKEIPLQDINMFMNLAEDFVRNSFGTDSDDFV